MADYEKLIKQDINNGPYAIIFQNVDRFSVEEIKKIFSIFGKVVNVKVTGDETGYRFVRYESYQEAQKAVDCCQNHPTIKLLPHRKKNKNNEEKSHTGFQSSNSPHQRTTDNENGFKMNKENYNTSYKSKNNTNHRTDDGMDFQVKHNGFDRDNHNKNYSQKITAEQLFQNHSRLSKNKSSSYSNNSSRESLQSECSEEQNVINQDEIPDLVSFKRESPAKKNAVRKTIIDAQVVIFGNIHPKISPSYILHLVDEFEPLAITEMQTIPSTDIRFCLVYFKTVEESLCAENKFDKLDLLGKKLVVLQEDSLVEEATLATLKMTI